MKDTAYRLKLKSLKFLSAVDFPAQAGIANALLLKRAGDVESVTLTAKVSKLVDIPSADGTELGLVFGFAFGSSKDGGETPYIDLQRDWIEPDFLKAAMDFMAAGAPTDVNHDNDQDGRVIFAWPLVPEINKAMGISADTVGLAVAVKPSAETYKRFKTGELTGFSIEGQGERSELKTMQPKRNIHLDNSGHYRNFDDADETQPIVCVALGKRAAVHYDAGTRGNVLKAKWTTATIDDLPDSSFLYIEGGGEKDKDGKTTPRSLRHFPYKDENGKVDLAHLRDAISRIPQSSLPATLRNKLQAKAEKILGKQHEDSSKRASLAKLRKARDIVRKDVVLTSIVDGHQHAIDLDDPAEAWRDGKMQTTYGTSEGAGMAHSHVWTFDETTGEVTVAMDSGHAHQVSDVVPPEVLAIFRINEQAEDAQDAQQLLQRVLDGDAGSAALSVNIAARAPRDNSTPANDTQHGGGISKETTTMPDAKDLQIADLTKRAERAERIAKMSGAHKTHFDSLTGDDAEAFLAKSASERDAIIADVGKRAAEAVAVVYTSKTTGAVFRKNDDVRLIEMAKREDEREEKIEKAEIESLAKSHLGNLAGEDGVHGFVMAACRDYAKRLGEPGKALLEKAQTAMKGWNQLGIDAKKAKGFNPGNDVGPVTKSQAMAALTAGLTEFAKKNNLPTATLWTEGLAKFVATPEGAALQQAYDEAHATATGAAPPQN